MLSGENGIGSTKKAPRIRVNKASGTTVTVPLSSAADQTSVGSCDAPSSLPCNDILHAVRMIAVEPFANASAETSSVSPHGGGEDTMLTTGSQDVAVVKERKKRVVVAKPLWEPSAGML